MIGIKHKSSINVEKQYVSYTWTLKDWPLLYDHYYKEGIESPEFCMTGTEGCTARIKLNPGDSRVLGTLNIKFNQTIKCHLIEVAVYLVNETTGIAQKLSVLREKSAESIQLNLGRLITRDAFGTFEFCITGTVILRVDFTIVKSIEQSKLETETSNGISTTDVSENLLEMLDRKSFCDFTIVIGEQKFPVHKVILAARSEVFKAMFANTMKESEDNCVEIDDIDPAVFEKFLNYVYSGRVLNLKDVVTEMIIVAEKYLMNNLKVMCEKFMVANINNENAIKYLVTSHRLNCVILKEKVLNFIKSNTHVLANTDDYKILYEYPELIKEVFGK